MQNDLSGEKTKMRKEKLSWVEVDRKALEANLLAFRRRVGKAKLCLVVKSEAYGSGIVPAAKIAQRCGVDRFGVVNLDEAEALREAGIRKPILILGYVTLKHLPEVVKRGYHLTVFNLETLRRLSGLARRMVTKARIHLKLETGTHRYGIMEQDLLAFGDYLYDHPELSVEGASMHFANIEDTTDHTYAMKQIERFEHLVGRLEADGIHPKLRHTACTAATILFTKTHFDMVRLGIGAYGCWPSRETFVSAKERKAGMTLRPALTWKTVIGQIKEVPTGSAIGYGGTYKTTRPARIAVLPMGYYEGYDRGLSNGAYVLVRGKRAPVRGRVCMNVMMVDVTDIPEARLEDEVVLLGSQGEETIPAEQLASWAGTINYEILSRINPELPRIVV
jgi:alanine racemase